VPGKAKAPSPLHMRRTRPSNLFGSDRSTRAMFEILKRIIPELLDGIDFVIHVWAFIGGAPSKFSAERPDVPDRVRVPEYPDHRN